MLQTLAHPRGRVLMQVCVARLKADSERWAFYLVAPQGVPDDVRVWMVLVVRGSAFFPVLAIMTAATPCHFLQWNSCQRSAFGSTCPLFPRCSDRAARGAR